MAEKVETRRKHSFMTTAGLLLISTAFLGVLGLVSPGAASATQKILLLHSYHQGFEWTDSIHRGIMESLDLAHDKDLDVYVEYLNTTRNPEKSFEEVMADLFKRKYKDKGVVFDVIISSDDGALNFLRERGEFLFGAVPKVFCGVNDFTPDKIKGMSSVTGVNEAISIKETLEGALTLLPNLRTAAVVAGARPTEMYNLRLAMEASRPFKEKLNFIWLGGLEPDELKANLSELKPGVSAVLYLNYLLTPSWKYLTVQEGAAMVREATEAPIFTCWDYLVLPGIIGGKVVHGRSQGSAAAELALRVLAGEKAGDIPVLMTSPNQYVFNASALRDQGIPEGLLPSESQIVGRDVQSLMANWRSLSKETFFGYELFAENPRPMFFVDPDTGIIVAANESARGFYGYADIVGININEINTLSQESIKNEMLKAQDQTSYSFSFIHRLADGSLRNVRVYSSPLIVGGKKLLFSMVHDETAIVTAEKALQRRNLWFVAVVAVALGLQTLGLFVLLRNNRKRRRAEKALRASERKFSALFASMTEMVAIHELVFDEEGRPVNYRITECNGAFEKDLAIPREKAVGLLATEVYGVKEAPYLEEYARVALSGEPLAFETYFAPLDRSFFINVVSPEKNTFATVSTDISQIKRAEMLIEEKNKELEQMVYVASHDLRSPLVNVEGYGKELEYSLKDMIDSLNDGGLSAEERKEFLNGLLPDMTDALMRIRGSARQMDSLLAGLLKLSRSGRAALSIGPVDMNDLVRAVVSSLQFQIGERGATVTVGDLPPCKGDGLQLSQVFSNLLGNALKYLDPSKSGEISVKGRKQGDLVLYEVRDNGVGIAEEHQERIFELFHRLDPAKGDGEGLGLTIVRQILWRLGGKVSVESQLGQGSLFRVTLPAIYTRGE